MASLAEDVTSCAICLETFVYPQILPCHHSFCKACLDRLRSGDVIECPTCRAVCKAVDAKCDFKTVNFIAVLRQRESEIRDELRAQDANPTTEVPAEDDVFTFQLTCELCEERSAERVCCDCRQVLCVTCQRIHLKSTSGSEHRVETFVEKLASGDKTLEDFRLKLNGHLYLSEKVLERVHTSRENALAESKQLKQDLMEKLDEIFEEVDQKIARNYDPHISSLKDSIAQLSGLVGNAPKRDRLLQKLTSSGSTKKDLLLQPEIECRKFSKGLDDERSKQTVQDAILHLKPLDLTGIVDLEFVQNDENDLIDMRGSTSDDVIPFADDVTESKTEAVPEPSAPPEHVLEGEAVMAEEKPQETPSEPQIQAEPKPKVEVVKKTPACSVCGKAYRNPVTLPKCKHTFCRQCIDGHYKKKRPRCPECGESLCVLM